MRNDEDYGYYISWGYLVEKMRTRYGIAPTNYSPKSMREIERMLNEIWYEYPGYAQTHDGEKVTE